MIAAEQVDVVVVGAGPAGLTTAIALARHGVGCLVVERRPDLSSLPRATAISVRSMELLRGWGLEEQLRAGGTEVDWLQWICATLADADAGHGSPTGYPTRAQSLMLSPTSPACVPQDHLEPVLLEHLQSLPGARAELGVEVTGLAPQPAGGARLRLRRGGAGAAERVVEARYVVAADGAHSTIRRALGIPMEGPDDLARAVSALFTAPLSAVVGDRRYGLYFATHPEAQGVFLPAGRGDRWVYGVLFGATPDDPAPADLGEAGLAQRIRLASGVAGLQPRIARTGAFRFAAQLAAQFRQGDVFLVGDAAHRATPRGGTGMNTAIHDGFDLGWKLAWVLRDWAPPALLDSYEAERRPVAEHNVGRSAQADGTARAAEQELHVDLGGRLRHAWVRFEGRRMSTLDLLADGLTLVTGPGAAAWRRAAAAVPAGGPPVAVREVDAITARALGVAGAGALLVRPDGATAMWFASDAHAQAGLRRAVDAVAGGPPISGAWASTGPWASSPVCA